METNGEKMFTVSKTWVLVLAVVFEQAFYKAGGNTYADPWVLERFLCGDSLGRVYGEHLIDEVFGFRSNCVPLGRWKLPEETKTTILKPSWGTRTSLGGYLDIFIYI